MINWDKPIEAAFEDGRVYPARLLGVLKSDGRNHVIAGAVGNAEGVLFADPKGNGADFIVRNIPQKVKMTVWLNMYLSDGAILGEAYRSRENADIGVDHDNWHIRRIACLEIPLEFEEGEGL